MTRRASFGRNYIPGGTPTFNAEELEHFIADRIRWLTGIMEK
jgi:hypothetical protein